MGGASPHGWHSTKLPASTSANTEAESIAKVLHYRLGSVDLDNETRNNLPSWITEPPAPGNGPGADWAIAQAELIATRR